MNNDRKYRLPNVYHSSRIQSQPIFLIDEHQPKANDILSRKFRKHSALVWVTGEIWYHTFTSWPFRSIPELYVDTSEPRQCRWAFPHTCWFSNSFVRLKDLEKLSWGVTYGFPSKHELDVGDRDTSTALIRIPDSQQIQQLYHITVLDDVCSESLHICAVHNGLHV